MTYLDNSPAAATASAEYEALRLALRGRVSAADDAHAAMVYAVRWAMRNALTPRQLLYVDAYYSRQMCLCDIAEVYGVAPSTVSRTLARARERIRACCEVAKAGAAHEL